MKIRIVTEKEGWILHRMAREIAARLRNVRINEDWPDADIHYYINYGYYHRRMPHGLIVANFTHYDPDNLGDKFVGAAREADHCIAISEQTAEILRGFGVPEEKLSVVLIGADERFRPALTLGVVGRPYPGGRKGEKLLEALLNDAELMRDLLIVSTSDGWGVPVWEFEDAADFYRCIDYLLVPAVIEGGPVPFMEALACGTLSIAPPIGVIPDFPHIEYPTGDFEILRQRIMAIKQEHLARKRELSRHIEPYDWDLWAAEHKRIFKALLDKGK
jgi:glycosyltransferase involved in cell wall biosynthesis